MTRPTTARPDRPAPLARLARLAREESGIAAIEYALIASLIAVALGGTIVSLGSEVRTHYDEVETSYAAVN